MSSLSDVCQCCGGYENQPILQLFEDKCFKVVDGSKISGEFCLNDFAFPVDGHNCIGLNAEVSGGEVLIFDNQLDPFNTDPLTSGKLYARGVMIRVYYPTNDLDGEEIGYTDKSVTITIQNATTFAETEYPLHDFFTIFTNAKSNVQTSLINKVKITNPNTNYVVRISALVVYGEAE